MVETFQVGDDMAKVNKITPIKKKRKGPVMGPRLKAGEGLEEFTLSTTLSKPSINIGDYSILFYGSKKIGKTTLAALFPESYFMKFEEGTKALSVYGDPMKSWAIAKKAVRLLKKDKKYKTVVVDTADASYALCFDDTCQEKGWDHPSDEGYGKGWSEIKRRYSRWVTDLLNTGKGVIFISHASNPEVRRRDGSSYNQVQPTMAGQAREILEGIVDIWGYYHYDDGQRVLQIRGDDDVSAGHRLENNFKTPDGEDLKFIYMGATKKEGYKNLIDAFNNRYIPPKRKESSESTPIRKKVKKKVS
jgi:hypothetical protein